MPRVAHHLVPFHWKRVAVQPSVWEHCEWHVQQAPVLAEDCVNVYFRVVPVDVSLCQILLKLHTQFSATSEVSWACWQLFSEAGKRLLEVQTMQVLTQSSLSRWDLLIDLSSVTIERELQQLIKCIGQYQLLTWVDSNSLRQWFTSGVEQK